MFYPYEVYHVALAYAKLLQGLALGGHDGSFLILDRVGRVDFVVHGTIPHSFVADLYTAKMKLANKRS